MGNTALADMIGLYEQQYGIQEPPKDMVRVLDYAKATRQNKAAAMQQLESFVAKGLAEKKVFRIRLGAIGSRDVAFYRVKKVGRIKQTPTGFVTAQDIREYQ